MTGPDARAAERRPLRALLLLAAGATIWARIPFVTPLFHGGDYGWVAQAWRLAEPTAALRGGWTAFHLLHGVLAIPFALGGSETLLGQSIFALGINVATALLVVGIAYERTRSLALAAAAAAILALAPAWALASNLIVNNPSWGLLTAASFFFLARRERTGAARDYALAVLFAALSWFVYVFGILTLAYVLAVGLVRLRARVLPYAVAAAALIGVQALVFGFDWTAGAHRNLVRVAAEPPPFLAANARLVLNALLPGFWNWADLVRPHFVAMAVVAGALTAAGAIASPGAAAWALLYLIPFGLTANVQSQHAYYALPGFVLVWISGLAPLKRLSPRAPALAALALIAAYAAAARPALRSEADQLRARAAPLSLDCVDPATVRALRELRARLGDREPVYVSGPVQNLWLAVMLPGGEEDQARLLKEDQRRAAARGELPAPAAAFDAPAAWRLDVSFDAEAPGASRPDFEVSADCADGRRATARAWRTVRAQPAAPP